MKREVIFFKLQKIGFYFLAIGLLSACNLTVIVNGNGVVSSDDKLIDCSISCTTQYLRENTTIALTATAGAGSGFDHWSDNRKCLNTHKHDTHYSIWESPQRDAEGPTLSTIRLYRAG